ncbi:hypothetical protein H8959_006153 [Pygathrix nigripes]
MELGGAVTIFLALCLSCLLILTAWKRMNKAGKLPPGPTPIPFLGNLLQLREKYGPVFTVYMGLRPVVVLCGHEAVKEALVGQADEFSGHGELASIERNFQGHGVALANGERWRILQCFSLTILRDFGIGKQSIEERIQIEASYLLEDFWKTKGAPIDPTFLLSCSISNVISSVVFGSCFDYEDKQFLNLLRLINESFIEMSTPWAQASCYSWFTATLKPMAASHQVPALCPLWGTFCRWTEEAYSNPFRGTPGTEARGLLCGVEAILEAVLDNAEAFSGRGKIAIMDPVYQGYGVIFANGNRWKVLQRFSLVSMKDFGMGKRSVEERIQEEAQCLIEELRKSKGALVDPTFFFHSITTNIICSIVFGKRFHYQDQEFLKMLNLFCQSFSLIRSAFSQLFEFFSGFLKYLPRAHRQLYKNPQEINAYTGHSVEKHGETLDPSAPQDLIDTYLLHMEKEKSNPHSKFNHQNLIINTFSLFFAGTETTSTTLRYGFLLMLTYPHVAVLNDQAKMPYTEAVIHEIQRFADLLPMGVPHIVTQQTSFRGYIIPKDMEVYLILSTALHDPHYFEKPDAFNPDHFLDASGALKKNEAFIPFSLAPPALCSL